MRKVLEIIFVITLFVQFQLHAQSIGDNLTLDKAIQLCLDNNLTLQQQQERVKQAQTEIDVIRADYFPSFGLKGSYVHISELAQLELPFNIPGTGPVTIEAGVKNQYDLNAYVNQPLFTGFRTRNLIKAAEQQTKEIREQLQISQNLILLNIYKIFYAAQLNYLQQNILNASIKRKQGDLHLVKNFLEAGQVSPFDTMKVSNQVLSLQTQLKTIQHDEIILLSELALTLNIQNISSIEPASLDHIIPSIEPLDVLQNQAVKFRPEIAQITHRLNGQDYRKKAVRSGFFPQVFGQASYHYARPGVNFFEDEWSKYYTLGVNLKWELWNRGKTRNQIKQLNYAINTLTLEQEKLIQNIQQEVKQAYERLLSDKDNIATTTQLVEQERERYRITREKYQQGVATTIDLSDAENALTMAELQLRQSYINWLKDRAGMRYVTGTIDEIDEREN